MKREEQLKNEIAKKYFAAFDATKIIGNVDFAVALKSNIFETEFLFWAEAKKGNANIENSISQLILTIGKAKTYTKHLPPKFIGCFDNEKIAFIRYGTIKHIFKINDFDWNVTPSNYQTKEFKIVLEKVKTALQEKESYIFDFQKQHSELKEFIKSNFKVGGSVNKIQITEDNFETIFYKWQTKVKPTINVDWAKAKKQNILDCYFYLADVLSENNKTLDLKGLHFKLKNDYYGCLEKQVDGLGLENEMKAQFKDNQKAHKAFWNIYERPPEEKYFDIFIKEIYNYKPQDFRERKGSFYTPEIWVKKSQESIKNVLGKNWQSEYYIWDCCCGTGNLLAGLKDKYRIFASDIEKGNIANLKSNQPQLLEQHCFAFDFLNDPFKKLPPTLYNIIKNEPHKLLIYINPPYAESGNKREMHNEKENQKTGVSKSKIKDRYCKELGNAKNELFAQFLFRIYKEIPNCKIANFSKLKNLQGANFQKFRAHFTPKLKSLFLVPANSFHNVKGKFPIGFFIWDGLIKEVFTKIKADVYNEKANFINTKNVFSYSNEKRITKWASENKDTKGKYLGNIDNGGNASDFQHNNLCQIQSEISSRSDHINITPKNLLVFAMYFSVRKIIPATWQNDRDQFLYPNKKWKEDAEFQNDCLAYTLFHKSNNIKSEFGMNHWIPFYEKDVNAKAKFQSNFIPDFIKENNLEFSKAAKAVFEAGKKLFQYYHSQNGEHCNASFYDIRGYFQGFKILANGKKRMNAKSEDVKYNEILKILKTNMQLLGNKIEPKIYEYGFLKE